MTCLKPARFRADRPKLVASGQDAWATYLRPRIALHHRVLHISYGNPIMVAETIDNISYRGPSIVQDCCFWARICAAGQGRQRAHHRTGKSYRADLIHGARCRSRRPTCQSIAAPRLKYLALSVQDHLATALAVEAVRAGKLVYFIPLADLVAQLAKAEREGTLRERIRLLCRASLLVVEEIGYLPVTPGGGNLFFQLVNARYEKGAMILTSNRGFAEWGDIFGSPVVATALLDRLLHHAVVIQIEGSSYRMREHAALIPENLRQPSRQSARRAQATRAATKERTRPSPHRLITDP